MITRARRQGSGLTSSLQSCGAIPILIPTIEIVPPESFDSLDHVIAQIESFDWLIFTSANAVEFFAHRWDQMSSQSSRGLPKIAVIGPATARVVRDVGLRVDLIAPRYIAESLAESLVSEAQGKHFVIVRAAEARNVIPDILTRAGGKVTIAEAYRNRIPSESIPALRQLFATPENYPDAILFTSASTVHNLMTLLGTAGFMLPSGIALASIGPITSQALSEYGLSPTIEAAESTIDGLIRALDQFF